MCVLLELNSKQTSGEKVSRLSLIVATCQNLTQVNAKLALAFKHSQTRVLATITCQVREKTLFESGSEVRLSLSTHAMLLPLKETIKDVSRSKKLLAA